jgi:hypothetical protein
MSSITEKYPVFDDWREQAFADYVSAKAKNKRLFREGNVKATEEYIFPNQMLDANSIVDKFYNNNRRVVSVQKRTKVGADGLMIEIAKLMTTHIDDNFVVDPYKVRIITGMSNTGWESDMKDKSPECFRGNIFHHGQLSKSDLCGLKNGLIIIDEIDTGDKEEQVLHKTLDGADILDIKYMEENNLRIVVISATMIRELYQLHQWGEYHESYTMSIPDLYIGHGELLEMGIIQEFYQISDELTAMRWVREDILENYGDDFRVHIIRLNGKGKNKNADIVQTACQATGVVFKNHTSDERLTEDEIKELFDDPLKSHVVLGVKGFFRRANLIPNQWKVRIGATHELYTKTVDNNVQIQGLPGRMTGYWRNILESGHKTGPYTMTSQIPVRIQKLSRNIWSPYLLVDRRQPTVLRKMVSLKSEENFFPSWFTPPERNLRERFLIGVSVRNPAKNP